MYLLGLANGRPCCGLLAVVTLRIVVAAAMAAYSKCAIDLIAWLL